MCHTQCIPTYIVYFNGLDLLYIVAKLEIFTSKYRIFFVFFCPMELFILVFKTFVVYYLFSVIEVQLGRSTMKLTQK